MLVVNSFEIDLKARRLVARGSLAFASAGICGKEQNKRNNHVSACCCADGCCCIGGRKQRPKAGKWSADVCSYIADCFHHGLETAIVHLFEF